MLSYTHPLVVVFFLLSGVQCSAGEVCPGSGCEMRDMLVKAHANRRHPCFSGSASLWMRIPALRPSPVKIQPSVGAQGCEKIKKNLKIINIYIHLVPITSRDPGPSWTLARTSAPWIPHWLISVVGG